jgi:hypothetical protein
VADHDLPTEGIPGDEPDDVDDPFAGLTLDDAFVAGASVREESADERLARLARIEAEHRRLADERRVQQEALDRSLRRQARRRGRVGGHRQRFLVISLMLVVFAGLLVWNVRKGTASLAYVDASAGSVTSSARPRAGVGASEEPLGTPPPLARESSAYAFMATQEGSDEPVAYDPCRVIHVVVNGRTAFLGSDEMVQGALVAASTATGLQIVYDGLTDEGPSTNRAPYQPDRYGETWAPVLISWTDPTEVAELDGDIAGLGGSVWVTQGSGSVYVTGSIELDGPQIADIQLREGTASARSVIEHELGHVLGLDHVNDPSQLMNPTGNGVVTTYADGDRTGLWHLGQGACYPDV